MPRIKGRHVDDPTRVGHRLREARVAKGVSQRALAFEGCTPAYISRIEAGDRIPSYQLLLELGRRLGVSASYLATGAEEEALGELESADLLLRLGETEEAEATYEKAIRAEDEAERGRGHRGLGIIAFAAGRLEDALDHLISAQRLLGSEWRIDPAGPEQLVRSLAMSGRLEEAIAEAERVLGETPAEDTVTRERYIVLLANALIDNGRFERAIELLASALANSGREADPLRLSRLLWSQSRLHTARGEHETAAQYARRAIAVLEITEFVAYTARARQVLAYIENESGHAEAALEALETGWRAMEDSGDPYLAVIYRIERARALVALGQLDEARQLASDVLGRLEGLGPIDAARASTTLGQVFASAGEKERALELFEAAATQLEQIGSPLVRDVYSAWADVLDHLGRRNEAYDVLRKGLNLSAQHAAR